MVRSGRKWFRPKIRSGWKKSYPAGKRRRLELKARHGDYLSAARAKQALANVTRDKETKKKAKADADYFYALHRKRKRRTSR